MKTLIWQRPDGGISMTYLLNNDAVHEARVTAECQSMGYKMITACDCSEIPVRDKYRNALRHDGKKFYTDPTVKATIDKQMAIDAEVKQIKQEQLQKIIDEAIKRVGK